MSQAILAEWHVTIRCEHDQPDPDGLNAALDAKLRKALAIIEDELRHKFGDVANHRV